VAVVLGGAAAALVIRRRRQALRRDSSADATEALLDEDGEADLGEWVRGAGLTPQVAEALRAQGVARPSDAAFWTPR